MSELSIPSYISRIEIARRMGISSNRLSQKLNKLQGQRITPKDEEKITRILSEISKEMDLKK